MSPSESPAPPAPMPGDAFLPSLIGPIGLYHTSTAEVGPVHSLRLGLHGQFFRSTEFLIQGDTNTRLQGGLTFGFTPHESVEIFGAFLTASNRNQRCGIPGGGSGTETAASPSSSSRSAISCSAVRGSFRCRAVLRPVPSSACASCRRSPTSPFPPARPRSGSGRWPRSTCGPRATFRCDFTPTRTSISTIPRISTTSTERPFRPARWLRSPMAFSRTA